jgi:hypothetical protein
MRIEYTCADDSRTIAIRPSIALLYWLCRSRPTIRIDDLEPLTVSIIGPPPPNDEGEMFLTLVFAEVERRWNKILPFEIVLPDSDQEYGGSEYQSRCLEILQWLLVEGDITRLHVS